MFTLIIDILADVVVRTIDFLGYPGVFFLMLVESCGIPMPSEIIMPFSGFLVAEGKMNFWAVSFVGAFANLAGSLIAYWIGLKGGRALIEKYGKYVLISKRDLDLADRWFMRFGNWTVFFGRLLPVVRTYISFPAGVAKMEMKRFSLYTFAGALLWSILFTWLGVKMGDNWGQIREKLHNFDLAIVVLIVIGITWYVWRHIKHRVKQ
ncbi:MAG: alkaline phosphatase [Candidatus Nealsonbacteria bacterium RIFCSPLOWO2_12_FULL_39_31]|uniref:Alkaline phosphatase n=1 Tax=Candidatus Nealsonbacteria bacterium RIFCSPLOWO2_12_FULL_39_31 TaxID=1801676 RepID=A0A1G2ELE7_9BACT|nr:MAG: alkaline phosphatase [Candidatus Nealsonbacteria bacterium RIFCSPLOWO2_12_FULL_39_31]